MIQKIPLPFTILTIFGNYLIPKINKTSVGFVAGNNKLDIQPAGWTFSIWSIIYSGLIYLTYNLYKGNLLWDLTSIRLYILSCILNLYWMYIWTSNKPNESKYLLFGIVTSLTLLWYHNIGLSTKHIYQNILAVYIAWTLGASLLNIYIAKGENNIETSTNIIYLISLIQMLWQIINKNQNNINDSILFPITGVWTGLGIATNNASNLGLLKYLPLIVSVGCSYNQYDNLTNTNLKTLLFE